MGERQLRLSRCRTHRELNKIDDSLKLIVEGTDFIANIHIDPILCLANLHPGVLMQ
jgi:hypothetical protein